MMGILVKDSFPSSFFSCKVGELHELLAGPSLFYIPGQKEIPLVISTLLHGNEWTGVLALQKWLRPYATGVKVLPRSLWVFIGNTEAAYHNQRMLQGRVDYNRIWRGHSSDEGKMASDVMANILKKPIFAAIDIHNNSGRNPHYACVSKWVHDHLWLASFFGRTIVHAEQPIETFTYAFSEHAPSVTLEVGISGEPRGVEHTAQFLEAMVQMDHFPKHALSPRDVDTYQTVATVKVKKGTRFCFTNRRDDDFDLCLREDLDLLNFAELKENTLLGTYRTVEPPLLVRNSANFDPGLLTFTNNEIRTSRTLTPAMLTLSQRAIEEDCLGYLMMHKPILAE